MPRNVVTVIRRRSVFRGAGWRERQDLVLAQLAERYRIRMREEGDGVDIDFPKSLGRRTAKEEVVAELARIDPAWPRLLVVYPRESALRDRER